MREFEMVEYLKYTMLLKRASINLYQVDRFMDKLWVCWKYSYCSWIQQQLVQCINVKLQTIVKVVSIIKRLLNTNAWLNMFAWLGLSLSRYRTSRHTHVYVYVYVIWYALFIMSRINQLRMWTKAVINFRIVEIPNHAHRIHLSLSAVFQTIWKCVKRPESCSYWWFDYILVGLSRVFWIGFTSTVFGNHLWLNKYIYWPVHFDFTYFQYRKIVSIQMVDPIELHLGSTLRTMMTMTTTTTV